MLSHSIIFLKSLEPAPTSYNEDSSHILGEFNLQTIKIYQNASTCKERSQSNNTKLRIQQHSYSGASGCGTALRIKGCRVVSNCFGIVLISGPGRVQNHRKKFRKMDLLYINRNGAVWSSISIISARAVQCTSALLVRLLLLTAM